MPSIVTHYLFSEDVRNNTLKHIKKSLSTSLETYHIFAQSFDNLFYYNLFSLKKGANIRLFGNIAQRTHTNEYFKNIILQIKKEKLQNNPEILAYLYGSLTHYVLDSNCHPFIIFHAGWMDHESPNYKYRGNHEKIEVSIDAVLYQEKKNAPLFRANIADTLLPNKTLTPTLKHLMNNVFAETFHQKNIGTIYEKSAKQGRRILKYLVTDHYGLKKISYKLFDKIFFKNFTKYQNLSFFIKKPEISYLNRSHELWSNPIDNTITSTESFDDLYQKALKEALFLFDLTDKVINNKINLEDYLNNLGDKSYTTGLNWHKKEEYKFFKN